LKILIFASSFIVQDSCSIFWAHSAYDAAPAYRLKKKNMIKDIALFFSGKIKKEVGFILKILIRSL
jgi:hypothetical protein